MNGIRFQDYLDFTEKWKLVTARYRTENTEQRIVWANDLAYGALIKRSTDYPDGATFAKVAMVTEQDPIFPNSRVPSGAARYQFMVRDKVKYASTDGWGYALFDGAGKSYSRTHQSDAQACMACHRIANASGEVFSRPFGLKSVHEDQPAISKTNQNLKIHFIDSPAAKLPRRLRAEMPGVVKVRLMVSDLSRQVFAGTLDEVTPLLLKEAKASHFPAVFLSEDKEKFSALMPEAAQKNCPDAQSFKVIFASEFPSPNPNMNPYSVVGRQQLCDR